MTTISNKMEKQATSEQDTQDVRKEGTCCLCGGRFEHYGNNPWPLADDEDDRCCDKCDAEKVIPARFLYADFIRKLKKQFAD